MLQIEISNQDQKITKQAVIDIYKFRLPIESNSFFNCIGIDPGVTNMAMAVIPSDDDYGFAFQFTIPRISDPIQRIKNYAYILSDCNLIWTISTRAVVESSAYSAHYRQTEMAEARTSIIHWLFKHNVDIQLIAPNTIRKAVLGNGRTKAEEVWSGLPKDCLAALSCAYFATNYFVSEKSRNV